MARLEGVKAFDVKEGLIEKLKYKGDIYGRTKDLPKYGDIALVIAAWGDQIEGEYYLVNNEDNGMYELAKSYDAEKNYVFIEGELWDASTKPHRVEIFRKHVIAKEGDLIEMLEEDELFGYEINDRLPVFEDIEGGLYVVDKDGDIRYSVLDHKYKVVGKSEIEADGNKYKYVNRKAQHGDMIIPLETSSRYFTNGKLYGPVSEYLMIIDDYGDSLSVYSDGDNRTEDNVLVYEPVIENKTKGKRGKSVDDFVIGMQVKVNIDKGEPERGWGLIENNDVGKVTDVFATHIDVAFEKQEDWSAAPTELIILDENTEETEYKVGDLVEITVKGSHEFEIGEVVRLNKVDDESMGQPYKAEYIDGKEPASPWLYGHEFERFDGNLEEEDATLDETPKETSDYKIGDIVVVTVEWGSSALDLGDIGIISERSEMFDTFRVAVPGKENEKNFKHKGNIRHANEIEKELFTFRLEKEGAFA